ncbi:MAG: L,D-transpeptidase [Desulfobacula sp.]|nr:L,D-transpeptidase [Desulfobacula sp.]
MKNKVGQWIVMNYIKKLNSLWPGCLVLLIVFFFDIIGLAKEHQIISYIIQLPKNENAILVEKKTQTFFLYSRENKTLVNHLRVPCSTGEIGGVKQKAGDKKTPEGVYFLKDEYEDKYLSPIYGKKAFPIDYPNFIDKRTGKNGSAIWIHGTNKTLKPMDSNGCIALEDSNVLKLADYITLNSTPVILVDQIEYIENNGIFLRQKEKINLFLNHWTGLLEKGTYQEYLSNYSSQYLPDIDFWRDLIKLRVQLSKSEQKIKLVNKKVGIYYHENVYVILFEQYLLFDKKEIFLGKRKLFLSSKDGEYKIVGDVYQFIPETFNKEKNPLLAAVQKMLNPKITKDHIFETLQLWLAAWSSKDIEKYASFYADNFFSDGLNKKKWVRRKKILSKKYAQINVSGSKFSIRQKNNKCEIDFYQKYESSGFTAHGIKRLKLIKIGGSWKIYQESWKRK